MTIPAKFPSEAELASVLTRLADNKQKSRANIIDLLPPGRATSQLSKLVENGIEVADGVIVDACLWIDAWHRRRHREVHWHKRSSADGGSSVQLSGSQNVPNITNGSQTYYDEISTATKLASLWCDRNTEDLREGDG